MAIESDPDRDEDGWEDEAFAEPRRNRFAEALMVFGLTFPFALLLVMGLAVVGIGLVIAVVYAMMWLLVQALASGPE